jgi:excisionase family DNA binding protein
MDTDALLSVEEAAKRLGGLSRWTVHAWLSQGKLRRTKVGGRTMIRESELARVIHEEDAPKAPTTKAVSHVDLKSGRSGGSVKGPDRIPNSRRQSTPDESVDGD